MEDLGNVMRRGKITGRGKYYKIEGQVVCKREILLQMAGQAISLRKHQASKDIIRKLVDKGLHDDDPHGEGGHENEQPAEVTRGDKYNPKGHEEDERHVEGCSASDGPSDKLQVAQHGVKGQEGDERHGEGRHENEGHRDKPQVPKRDAERQDDEGHAVACNTNEHEADKPQRNKDHGDENHDDKRYMDKRLVHGRNSETTFAKNHGNRQNADALHDDDGNISRSPAGRSNGDPTHGADNHRDGKIHGNRPHAAKQPTDKGPSRKSHIHGPPSDGSRSDELRSGQRRTGKRLAGTHPVGNSQTKGPHENGSNPDERHSGMRPAGKSPALGPHADGPSAGEPHTANRPAGKTHGNGPHPDVRHTGNHPSGQSHADGPRGDERRAGSGRIDEQQGGEHRTDEPSLHERHPHQNQGVTPNRLGFVHSDDNLKQLKTDLKPDEAFEFTLAPLYKRVLAEVIDFVLLFLLKFSFLMIYTHITENYEYPVDYLISNILRFYIFRSTNMRNIMVTAIHRLIGLLYEVVWTIGNDRLRFSSASPGKIIMNITIITCFKIRYINRNENKVLVYPATDLEKFIAVQRGLIKNVLIPMECSFFWFYYIFGFNRTGYDIISNTVVVELDSSPPRRIF